MRPCGPVPVMRAMSIPRCLATDRASGEAFNRSALLPLTAVGFGAAEPLAGSAVSYSAADSRLRSACWAGTEAAAAGLDEPPPLLRRGTSSPMTAITVPTGSTAPASAFKCRTPASSASISTLLLSVSISAITSPSFTVSPSCFFHSSRVPSSIASPILGIITSGINCFLLDRPHPSSLLTKEREPEKAVLFLTLSLVRRGWRLAAG